MSDTKATNPKDAIASNKIGMHLVPSTLTAHAALAFTEGAVKYGAYNWRASGIRASVYKSALQRHIESWWNGEDADPKTGVPHLANALACIGIILDAELCGKLTDDRPPPADVGALIRGLEAKVAHLKEIFSEHDPHHWTIADEVPE